ncbi:hypothetical protein B0H16DRAFT_1697153 [Mycena metata]|uniref:Uncharacterized protein n=1 Tax=Mycena metata TaxID=1033252 RepID=A0AAD7HW31_9AGAR|nr:hypothetical protein B0H16DRAFT_1697153 [Mycena metata]
MDPGEHNLRPPCSLPLSRCALIFAFLAAVEMHGVKGTMVEKGPRSTRRRVIAAIIQLLFCAPRSPPFDSGSSHAWALPRTFFAPQIVGLLCDDLRCSDYTEKRPNSEVIECSIEVAEMADNPENVEPPPEGEVGAGASTTKEVNSLQLNFLPVSVLDHPFDSGSSPGHYYWKDDFFVAQNMRSSVSGFVERAITACLSFSGSESPLNIYNNLLVPSLTRVQSCRCAVVVLMIFDESGNSNPCTRIYKKKIEPGAWRRMKVQKDGEEEEKNSLGKNEERRNKEEEGAAQLFQENYGGAREQEV